MTTTFTAASVGARDLRTNMQAMRFGIVNAGQQLQDLVIVAGMGSRAFGQMGIQIAQMASGFGPMGVAIGTVIALVSAAAGAVFAFGGNSKSAADDADYLTAAIDKQVFSLQDAIDQYADLNDAQLATTQLNLTASLQAQESEQAKLITQLDELIESYADVGGAISNVIGGSGPLLDMLLKQLGVTGGLRGELGALGEQYLEAKIGATEFAAGVQALAAADPENKKLQGFAEAVRNSANELLKAELNIEQTGDRLMALEEVFAGTAQTTDDLTNSFKRFTNTVDESLKLLDQVAADRRRAGNEEAREAERLAKQRTDTISGLQVEVLQLEKLSEAYGKGAKAVRDQEVANETLNVVRRLGLQGNVEEEKFLVDLLDTRRELTDSIDQQKKAEAELVQQQKKSEGLTSSLQDQLSLQNVLLQGVDKESEQYRIQVALIQAKRAAGGELTAQQEALVRQLERQSTVIDKQKEAREAAKKQAEEAEKLAFEPFKNALASIQDATAETFETIYSGGVKTFGDLADVIKGIFIRLAAEISALMVFRAATMSSTSLFGAGSGLAQTLGLGATAAGGAIAAPALGGGIAGWQAGLIGGPGAFGRVPGPGRSPTTAGIPGTAGFAALNQPWWRRGALGGAGLFTAGALGFAGGGLLGGFTGSSTGGQFGGAAGALLGGLTPFGPLGALAGGIGGGLLGGAIGGLFGGGPSGRESGFAGGSLLGQVQGSGKPAAFIRDFDRRLIDLLDTRQRGIADRMLKRAAGVSVKFQEELSEADKASLAAGRIGPIARGLGFRARGITGERGARFAPEEQLSKLGEALKVEEQIRDLTSGFGAFAQQARALSRQFDDMKASAREFGISLEGFNEARKKAGFELIRNQIQSLTGETPTFAGQLKNLRAEFFDIKKAAGEFGFSIEEVRAGLRKAKENLREQERERISAANAQRASIKGQIDALRGQGLAAQIAAINQQYAEASRLAKEYRLSEYGLAQARREALAAVKAQFQVEKEQFRLEIGGDTLGNRFRVLNAQFAVARSQAHLYGISLWQVTKAQSAARAEVIAQFQAEKEQFKAQLGITSLGDQIAALNAQFTAAKLQAAKYGVSLWQVVKAQAAAKAALIAQFQLEKAQFRAQTIGDTFANQLAVLNAEFAIAKQQAQRFGISIQEVSRAQQEATVALRRQQQAQIDAMAISIVSPFDELADPLKSFKKELDLALLQPAGQYRTAAEDFRRIANEAAAGSTTAIQQLTGAGQLFVQEAGRFGASPAQVAAIQEVASTIENVLSQIERAREDASRGLQDEIKRASDRQVDKLSELVAEVRLVGAEIRRLRG